MVMIDINKYQEFKPWYDRIIADFGFDRNLDKEARDLLLNFFKKRKRDLDIADTLKKFNKHIQSSSNILIYGCGPSLELTVEKMRNHVGNSYIRKQVHLAADGAAVLLREKHFPVLAVFTDLDGITSKEFDWVEFVIVHAHGDNIDKLNEFQEDIIKKENVIGTTQVDPKDPILNPGGFTDGDRIFYFLREFLSPTQKLYLIGMDFNGNIGKYSKQNYTENQEASPVKRKKLQYAIKLLDALFDKINNEIYFVDSTLSAEMKHGEYITFEEFMRKTIP
ncbi:MAG: DUF115 domain-containing protein [Candidatus Lokiarchaeota archaeon]|nr:DUF115 domain-containing protein [Candidatus Lokiarchaeota archaeon]